MVAAVPGVWTAQGYAVALPFAVNDVSRLRGLGLHEMRSGLRQAALSGLPLQNLGQLLKAPEVLEQALHQVVHRDGGRTAGVDGLIPETLNRSQRRALLGRLRRSLPDSYYPAPLRHVQVPKKCGDNRVIGVPTCADRVVETALLYCLGPVLERRFLSSCFGWRRQSNQHAAVRAIAALVASVPDPFLLAFDIRACFDSIRHADIYRLLAPTIGDPGVLLLVDRFLAQGCRLPGLGLSTGSALSTLFANGVLTALDHHVGRFFVRWIDNLVLVGNGISDAEQLCQRVEYAARYLGLHLHQKQIAPASIGIDALGYRIWTAGPSLRVVPTEQHVHKLREKLRAIFGTTPSVQELQKRVNALVRGWTGYFCFDDATLCQLAHELVALAAAWSVDELVPALWNPRRNLRSVWDPRWRPILVTG